MVEQAIIIDAIKASPGITQAELRHRFNAMNISMTLTKLRRWGAIEREQHGQTWRLYATGKTR